MTPYPEYKPTGLPWLPLIPKEWEIKKLRHLLSVVSEKGHQEAQLLSVVREKGVILRDKDNKEENHNYVPDDLSNYKFVKTGQFAMNKMKAWQGSYGISQFDGIVSPAYFVFALKGVSADFFHHAIRAQHYVPYFGQASDGIRVGQWDLSIPRMKEIPFCIPSTSEQAQIVRYLDAMTAKINKLVRAKKKQIALLQEQKQTIINNAVTKGLNPNAEMKDSGIDWLGKIPTHWKVKEIHRICRLQGGTGFPVEYQGKYTEPIPFIKVNSLASHIATEKVYDTISRDDVCKLGANVFSKGDIVFAKVGAALLLHRFEMLPFDCCIDNNMMAMYHIKENVQWLKYTLSLLNFNFLVNPGAVPSISQTQVGTLKIPCPPLAEQNKIALSLSEKCNAIEKTKQKVQNSIDFLTEYKKSLISSVVTGQVDVRNIAVEDISPADFIPEDADSITDNPEEEQPTAESEE